MAINLTSPSTLTAALLVTDTWGSPEGVTNTNGYASDAPLPFPRATGGVLAPAGAPVSAGFGIQSKLGGLYLGPMTTTQMNALNAAPGLMVFNTTVNGGLGALMLYVATTGWIQVSGSGNGSVSGPATSTVGHIATWNNATGTLLADSGAGIVGTTVPLTGSGNSLIASSNVVVGTGITAAAIAGANTTPIQILAAASVGAGHIAVVDSFYMEMIYSTAAFANTNASTLFELQYGAAAGGIVTATMPITNTSIQGTTNAAWLVTSSSTGGLTSTIANAGIYLTNNVGAIVQNGSASTFNWKLTYHLVTVT